MDASASAREGVENIYDPAFVKNVFDRCSARYITVSYICSFGFIERWRRQCVGQLAIDGIERARGYDLMAGTGEAWPHLLQRFANVEAIIAVDISSGMHERAMERLHHHRSHKIEFIESDVFKGELPDASADFVIATFGLKTFNAAQLERFAALIARVLKPGGSFSMIEASEPKGWLLGTLYMFYLQRVLPLVERFLLNGAKDFSMLGIYCENFGDASAFGDMLRAEGLRVVFRKHFFGCATSVSGVKP